MDSGASLCAAALADDGIIAVSGADARAFLHAQLTSDVAQLAPRQARRAGWCTAKGRLLATLLVVPHAEGFLLVLARDLLAPVLKRLQLFVLRSRVTLADASVQWSPFAIWGPDAARALASLGVPAPQADLELNGAGELVAVRVAANRFLLLAGPGEGARLVAALPRGEAADWRLAEIRAGLARVVQATQDLFVPQMIELQATGGVDFHKGCYPGQEIVARAQYRGQLKRRLARLRSPVPLLPGQDLYSDDGTGQPSGTVVNAARGEALAVLQIATLESGAAVRATPGGEALEVLPLPGAA